MDSMRPDFRQDSRRTRRGRQGRPPHSYHRQVAYSYGQFRRYLFAFPRFWTLLRSEVPVGGATLAKQANSFLKIVCRSKFPKKQELGHEEGVPTKN